MDTTLVIINILILLALVGVLFYMQKKHVSFAKRVFTGLGLGILLGVFLQFAFDPESAVLADTKNWYSIVGTGYVSFLKMIVMPLIVVSIISAIIRIKGQAGVGKISFSIIGILVLTTAIAAAVGIGSALTFDLSADHLESGEAEEARSAQLEETMVQVENQSFPERILQVIPTNPFLDLTGQRPTSTIATVIFAAFVGIAAIGVRRKAPAEFETFEKIINALYKIVMRIVTLILRLTPYGILALMATTIANTNVQGIIELSTFVIASYVALIVMFLIHLVILFFSGLNPMQYVKKMGPLLTFAFTSRSSAAAIPINIETQTKQFGNSEGIANFSSSLGASIGQNGCAGIYPAMLAVMIAPDPLDPVFLIQLVIIVAISSFGVAGVGGGATFAALIVLSSMNLPIGIAALLISVEPLIDMGRTALNVSGSATAGLVTGRMTGELNKEVYNGKMVEMNSLEA
ncbi:cation:dicarboxylase symporter family transporter [Pradoshia sp. D12]|uniref:L-cystine transporter n=1 Tax=Bacillaceae TaxID=186817 RepID=UPI001127FA70|nr:MULTISPECIES: cation:dicarboxylase symporter family transporter [Bacillaceae]QFK72779.1 cation:dicarboxylase symporter family transporter [Pradoshia sp. D12]TPF71773.1 cation:dicarboxylase symporter family transporter [Bacillus sp. D12]